MLLNEPIIFQRNFVLLTIGFSVCAHGFGRYLGISFVQLMHDALLFLFPKDAAKLKAVCLLPNLSIALFSLSLCVGQF